MSEINPHPPNPDPNNSDTINPNSMPPPVTNEVVRSKRSTRNSGNESKQAVKNTSSGSKSSLGVKKGFKKGSGKNRNMAKGMEGVEYDGYDKEDMVIKDDDIVVSEEENEVVVDSSSQGLTGHDGESNLEAKTHGKSHVGSNGNDGKSSMLGNSASNMNLDGNWVSNQWPKLSETLRSVGSKSGDTIMTENLVNKAVSFASAFKGLTGYGNNKLTKRCLLCSLHDESHSHLFLSCTFSKRLWERLKPMAKLDRVGNEWANVISRIVNKPATNTICSVIQRILFGAAMYFIWQERNVRRVQQSSRSEEVVLNCIISNVRLKLLGLDLKYTKDVVKAAKIWNLPIRSNQYYRDMVENLGCDA
ncbi:RNA-directed DNA polymerase, eukaryota, Reverse transcriptase zinc-binding domain protein [Artemisia annua]|uniref:RNA-directed DNA polymerase, eukaryota, Reverse transcriptase zinc-binding domain protein n=1 Tax=Artemisia annua TaxID=35608 RepID=A0A2U1L773_ARTAN|nr:RNA-directed DNA polymerase, eukaryota, Reverse transcriptase zinc-binding domain protein [Artemisia annua]